MVPYVLVEMKSLNQISPHHWRPLYGRCVSKSTYSTVIEVSPFKLQAPLLFLGVQCASQKNVNIYDYHYDYQLITVLLKEASYLLAGFVTTVTVEKVDFDTHLP